MKKIILVIANLLLCIALFSLNQVSNKYLNHRLNVKIDISNSHISVKDTIYFTDGFNGKEFYLNPDLRITSSNCKLVKLDRSIYGNSVYKINCTNDLAYLAIEYQGNIIKLNEK